MKLIKYVFSVLFRLAAIAGSLLIIAGCLQVLYRDKPRRYMVRREIL